MIQLRRLISIFLIASALLIGAMFSSGSTMSAIAEPVTPEAAQYEIDHARSPEEAGKRIQKQADDYKDELREDAQYTKQAAKNAAKGSQKSIKQATKTVKDRLNLDQFASQPKSGYYNIDR